MTRPSPPGLALARQLPHLSAGRSVLLKAADEGASYHRREREGGQFRRTITLPQPVESDKAQAQYEMGILTVTLPKAEEAKARKIEVVTK